MTSTLPESERCEYGPEGRRCREQKAAGLRDNYGLCIYHYQQARWGLNMAPDPKAGKLAPEPALPMPDSQRYSTGSMFRDEYESIRQKLIERPNEWIPVNIHALFLKGYLRMYWKNSQLMRICASNLSRKLKQDPALAQGQISTRRNRENKELKIVLIIKEKDNQ